MSKYPYPVLANVDSSYKDNIIYEITYVKNSCSIDEMIFEFDIVMNSEYLKTLIIDKKASMYMRVQSNIYTTVVSFDDIEGKCYFKVDTTKLQANDTLKFVSYIVANVDMQLEYNNEMLDIYCDEYQSKVRAKDLLAKSNEESLSYSTSNNDFIRFSVSEELLNNGYRIAINDNFINVTIGPDFNLAYGIVKNNKKDVCTVFDSHLVFEVFVYTLIEFIQDNEEYKNRDVYFLFEQIFMQCYGKSIEEFSMDVLDDGKVMMDQIFEAAHRMINNQIENSIIAVSKMEA